MKIVWGAALAVLFLLASCQGDEETNTQRRGKLIIGKSSVKTHISLTTVTSTATFTCNLGINATPCRKRRRKRAHKSLNLETKDEILKDELSPSSDTDVAIPGSNTNREGKLKFIFWSTVTSQFTITSTSTNTAMTFSVSFFCSVGGATYPPAC